MRVILPLLALLALSACEYNPAEQAAYDLAGPGHNYQPPPPPPMGPALSHTAPPAVAQH